MRALKAHTFRRARFKIRNLSGLRPPVVAQCDYHTKTLRIPVEGDTQHELDCIIHEAIHACMPYAAEDEVEETATSIARFLWRLGWRKEREA